MVGNIGNNHMSYSSNICLWQPSLHPQKGHQMNVLASTILNIRTTIESLQVLSWTFTALSLHQGLHLLVLIKLSQHH